MGQLGSAIYYFTFVTENYLLGKSINRVAMLNYVAFLSKLPLFIF